MDEMNKLPGRLLVKMQITLDPNGKGKVITLHTVHCFLGECQEILDKFMALNPALKRGISAEFIHVAHIY